MNGTEWGTDSGPDMGVAVLDQPGTGTGAETTPEVTPASPEVSPAADKGVDTETATRKTQDKTVDQDKELDEFGKTLTGKNKESWERLITARKEAEKSSTEYKTVLEKLAEHGINTPEDAAFIAQERDQVKTQLQTLTSERDRFFQDLNTNPVQFALKLKTEQPSAWNAIYHATASDAIKAEVSRLQQMALGASPDIPDGQTWGSPQQVLLDQAKFLGQIAAGFQARLNGARQTQQPKVTDQRQQELDRREQDLKQREDREWNGKIESAVSQEISDQIDKFIKNVAFTDKEQRDDFFDSVWREVQAGLEGRNTFLESTNTQAQNRNPQTISDIAKRYGREVQNGGLLERVVAKRLRVMGVQAKQAEDNRQKTLAKAIERREVATGGAASGSNGLDARKDEIFKQIDKEIEPGTRENTIAKVLWKDRA